MQHNVDAYIKCYDMWLASNTICHKLYGGLQSLPVPMYCWNNLYIDFFTGLPISTNWKVETYNSILFIVDRLIKMVNYKAVKVTIDASDLVEVIINVVV